VAVAISGTSGGFQKFCAGETDGNNASREIKESEIEECANNGVGYDGVQVANDALSLVVNPEFPVDCISVEQANQIWDEGSSVSSWDQVDGLDLPAENITLYGPGTDSGTFDFFTEVINGEEGKIRTDYTDIGEDDFAAITAVEGDPWAMGYIPYSYVQEAGDSVKALDVDGGDGCVEATLENVQDGSYVPLGRPLFLYASDVALARPEVVAFFEFFIENQAEIAEIAGSSR
jgi:phosphate transport system substrate-binding protein